MLAAILALMLGIGADPHHEHRGAGSAPDAEVRIAESGPYRIELRVPEEGIFSGEEQDIEFRLSDTRKTDPVEGGARGVANAAVRAVVSMPSMPGMPTMQPLVHREGVPGDYGIGFFFPHGGRYDIQLEITPRGKPAFMATLSVDVGDERPEGGERKMPFRLEVQNWPKIARAGETINLTMVVLDEKSGKVVSDFEIVHEQKFHLLIVSRDLGWFLHEHPVMDAKGLWTIPLTFPAGGEYGINGDVAPRNRGSMILTTSVKVTGPPPTWDTSLTPSMGPSVDGSLRGTIAPASSPIPSGQSTALTVGLEDVGTGKPAGDTQAWLGAAGHLMIFHEDGKTVVHSHPAENEEAMALVREGQVTFNARFPKPGLYRAYAQFQRANKIHTLRFTLEVP